MRTILFLLGSGAALLAGSSGAGGAEPPAGKNVSAGIALLPGVWSDEVRNPAWPSTFHDPWLTGFSPLPCDMPKAPDLWATIELGGAARWAIFLPDRQGGSFLLVQDARLRCIDATGKVVWERPGVEAIFYEPLHGDGTWTVGAVAGRTLLLLDARSGQPFWQRSFEGTIGTGQVRVARFLEEFPGKQLVVFPQYARTGQVFVFERGQRSPKLLWQTEEAGVVNWPQRADHGASVVVDPHGREIWNVRHHTINVFDAGTGRLLHRHEFRVRGKRRRNYGPVLAVRAGEANSLLAVMSQRVEHHFCCFRRESSGSFARLFERFFGYVYAPADHGACVAYTPSGLGDADADGHPDVAYSVRTAGPKPETRTVICDLSTGQQRVLPQTWLAGLADLDGDGKKEVLAYEDVAAEMPGRGTLRVFRFTESGSLEGMGRIQDVRLVTRPLSPIEQPGWAAWTNLDLSAPAVLTGPEGAAALVRRLDSGRTRLLKLEGGELRLLPAPSVIERGEVLAVGRWRESGPHLVVIQTAAGQLELAARSGDVQFQLPLRGGAAALSSAVDLNGDGRCELVTRCPDGRLRVHRIDDSGRAKLVWSAPFEAQTSRLSPLARDLTGDGGPEVVGFGRAADGVPTVRCHDHDGRILWETPLPMPGSSTIVKWIAGDFCGPGRSGLFVSVQQDLAREASFLLDGRNGRIVWQGPTANTPGGVRTCSPVGIPTAFDFNGDGWDDVLLDYRDYVAVLNGRDGSFLQSPISLPPVPAGWKVAYSSFTPVRASGRMKPHFLLPLGHGGIGLLGPDLRTEVWFHKPYYDTPQKVGLIDVDGDGRLEVGYEERRDGWFVCRDLWTGREKWRLKLPGAGYGACISADFDGDGKGEFFIGDCCLGTDAEGRGQLRWRAGYGAPYPLVADLDRDGRGELILPGSDGRLRVLKARPREPGSPRPDRSPTGACGGEEPPM